LILLKYAQYSQTRTVIDLFDLDSTRRRLSHTPAGTTVLCGVNAEAADLIGSTVDRRWKSGDRVTFALQK